MENLTIKQKVKVISIEKFLVPEWDGDREITTPVTRIGLNAAPKGKLAVKFTSHRKPIDEADFSVIIKDQELARCIELGQECTIKLKFDRENFAD